MAVRELTAEATAEERLKATALRLAAALVLVGAMLFASAAMTMAKAGPTLVVEAESGRVLHQTDARDLWYPASLTKLMTVYVMLDEVKRGRATLDTPITMTAAAAKQPPSKIGFKVGTQVTLEDAARIILVKSANDLSHAISETLGGSVEGFSAKMNAAARRIGMTDSNFVNAHGLPDRRQVTTAHDMAVLARALYDDFPRHEDMFRLPRVTVKGKTYKNYNGLIGQYPGADGMKTGYTCASGFNLVASASRRGRRVIAVVLGASTSQQREAVAATLLEKGFSKGFFSFAAPRLASLPRGATAQPVDMRPYTCSRPRRWTPQEQDDQVASLFGADIEIDRGRRAMRTNSIARAARPVTAGLGSALLPVKAFTGAPVRTRGLVPVPMARPVGVPGFASPVQAFAPAEQFRPVELTAEELATLDAARSAGVTGRDAIDAVAPTPQQTGTLSVLPRRRLQ